MTRLAIPFVLSLLLRAVAFSLEPYEEAPIHYWERPATDPVAHLRKDLRDGTFTLPESSGPRALEAVLEYLDVPIESQVLVFSKTSAQNSHISPATPRAIYYSDDIYVGWVQGGGIEILSYDRHLGAVCWFLDLTGSRPQDPSFLSRPQSCMNCHVRSSTGGVPGGVVRSVAPSLTGLPYFEAGTHTVTQETPIRHRWGGWYVTGDAGAFSHQGNALAARGADGSFEFRPLLEDALEAEELSSVIDASRYPGGAKSDIVALLIMEHQIQLQNQVVSANGSVRRLHHHTNQLRASLGEPPLTEPEGTLARVIESQAREIVEGLLFRDEFPLGDGVEGGEAFEEAFTRNRQVTQEGRSLKDLRLYQHVFKYRCSYTIYSEPFQHLTPWLKEEVYRQLRDALHSPEGSDASKHLSSTERERIFTILRETIPNLPDVWFTSTDG